MEDRSEERRTHTGHTLNSSVQQRTQSDRGSVEVMFEGPEHKVTFSV